MRLLQHRPHRDQSGTTTIEFTLVTPVPALTFGLVDFGDMFWQYNSATKAAQLGARMAAVSDPVRACSAISGYRHPWRGMARQLCGHLHLNQRRCSTGDCDGTYSDDYDPTAMQCPVFGRSQSTPPCDTECAETGIDGENGLCDRFDFVTPGMSASPTATPALASRAGRAGRCRPSRCG